MLDRDTDSVLFSISDCLWSTAGQMKWISSDPIWLGLLKAPTAYRCVKKSEGKGVR